METWLAIPETDGLYEVSDRGNVRSWHKVRNQWLSPRRAAEPRTLKQRFHPAGYLLVGISGRTAYVHRLVLLAFVGPAPEEMRTDHINAIRSDNRLENLRYATAKENSANMVRLGRQRTPRKLTDEDVLELKKLRDAGWKQADLAARFGICQPRVSQLTSR